MSFVNVPSFLYAEHVHIHVPSWGPVCCDIAFGGNFFAAVDVKSLGLTLSSDNLHTLIPLGREIKEAVNAKLTVQHPFHDHIERVNLTEFYERTDPSRSFTKSLVVFGAGQFDRSPCGTGVSATMATLYGKGELALDTEFIAESIIGTRFTGILVDTIEMDGITAVEPVVKGRASLTGIQQFVFSPDDPLKFGFSIQ
ncbi:MAG: hypothetical protein D3910_21690 [Candidatus Electrothrix sp. ATG2]|nr:hypothetical protein [Candidatus Electrothrix sp. ATG2]